MAFKIRNAANGGWIDLSAANTKIRNVANSAWINMSGSNMKIRNQANTAWITDAPTIPTVTTTSGFTTIMDVTSNPNHDTLSGGVAYGLWVDGPVYPWKGDDGIHRFVVCHSENFLFTVDTWNAGGGWGLYYVYDSPRLTLESQYSNRLWIFGKRAVGAAVYGLAHHEWYQTPKTVDGHPGFNGYASFNRRWVTGIKWMKSMDNGHSWAAKPTLDSQAMVITPEPWSTQSRDTLFGYLHPSNIVHEAGWYYAFCDSRQLPGGTNLLDCGFVMIRTNDLESAINWQYWNGSSWSTMNSFSYVGGIGPQQPYVFFKITGNDPYAADPGPISMAQAIRYHVPTGQWLLFGSNIYVSNTFCYCASETLANPQFEANGVRSASLAGGGVAGDYATYGGRYVSVFDPASTDQNFERIEGSTAIVIVTESAVRYRKQTISIT